MARKKARKVKRKSFSLKTSKRNPKTRKSKSNFLGGFIPLNMEESIIDFGIGAVAAPISEALKPLQEQYLGSIGQYADEATLGIVGVLAHKYGGKIHPMVKKGGRELFRYALFSSGQTAGSNTIRSMINQVGGNTKSNASANGVKTI